MESDKHDQEIGEKEKPHIKKGLFEGGFSNVSTTTIATSAGGAFIGTALA